MAKMGAEKWNFSEKSAKFLVFVLFEFVADLDRVQRLRNRLGGESCAAMCVWLCSCNPWRSIYAFFTIFGGFGEFG